jgi:hypothetical protein
MVRSTSIAAPGATGPAVRAELDLDGVKGVRSPDGAKGIGRIRLGPNPRPGEVICRSALLGSAVVDKAGRRP